MKPPMRQEVTFNMPVIDEHGEQVVDKYGKPATTKVNVKARVQYRSQLVTDSQGRERQVNLEIDIPSNVNPNTGTDIDFLTIAGTSGKGVIVAKEETTNISASKVYYRTVYVDG